MSTDYHTPWVDGTTEFKGTDMNAPLAELDTALGTHSHNLTDLSEKSYESLDEKPFQCGVTYMGAPDAAAEILYVPMVETVVFAADMGESRARAKTAATAEAVLSIKKNGVQFATCTFAIAGTAGSFSSSETTLYAGDVLSIVCPDPADATLATIGMLLVAQKSAAESSSSSSASSSSSSNSVSSSSSSSAGA